MKAINYFKKNGYIYGVSEKFEFGEWKGYAKKFDSLEEAEKWLRTEEYDLGGTYFLNHAKALKFFFLDQR